MPIVIGTKSTGTLSGSGSTFSRSHTQDAGSGKLILAIVAQYSGSGQSSSYASASYGGQAMTIIQQLNYSFGPVNAVGVFGLVNPPDGSNTFQVVLNGTQAFPIASAIQSYTGGSGFGNSLINELANTPREGTLTVQSNSLIYVGHTSQYDATKFTVNSVDYNAGTLDFQETTYNGKMYGHTSRTPLSAGNILSSVSTAASNFQAGLHAVEIREAAAVSARRVIIC